MKRFHVNVAVEDLQESVKFYAVLFNESPSVLKSDYAKWMLEDPWLNFSLSQSSSKKGINHIGLQADTDEELSVIQKRLQVAGEKTYEQAATECCYSQSSKTWVRDPSDVAWEAFVTHGEITHYGADDMPHDLNDKAARCCETESAGHCCV